MSDRMCHDKSDDGYRFNSRLNKWPILMLLMVGFVARNVLLNISTEQNKFYLLCTVCLQPPVCLSEAASEFTSHAFTHP